MPIRYEDRYASEIRQIARKRGIPVSGKTKSELIALLRGVSNPLSKTTSRRTPKRLQKYERCVAKLKKSPRTLNPYAICQTAVYGKKKN